MKCTNVPILDFHQHTSIPMTCTTFFFRPPCLEWTGKFLTGPKSSWIHQIVCNIWLMNQTLMANEFVFSHSSSPQLTTITPRKPTIDGLANQASPAQVWSSISPQTNACAWYMYFPVSNLFLIYGPKPAGAWPPLGLLSFFLPSWWPPLYHWKNMLSSRNNNMLFKRQDFLLLKSPRQFSLSWLINRWTLGSFLFHSWTWPLPCYVMNCSEELKRHPIKRN